MPGLINVPLFSYHVSSGATGRGSSSTSLGRSNVGNVSEEKPLLQAMPLIPELKSSQFLPTSIRPNTSVRTKKVTDPLADTVRARLYGDPVSTEKAGGNHRSTGSDHEPSSICLAAMVHEFMENEDSGGNCGRARCNYLNGASNGFGAFGSDSDEYKSRFQEELLEILEGLVTCMNNSERMLLAETARAFDTVVKERYKFKIEGEKDTSGCLKHNVMRRLRRAGFNAAICRARWDHSGGFPAGEYVYIDVLSDAAAGIPDRLIVDIDFRAQFEIARPTNLYFSMLQILPPIFVGNSHRLQQILEVMTNSAKESLNKKGLHLPPWRKPEYMRAKWFSQYERTTEEQTQLQGTEGNGQFAGLTMRGGEFDARYRNELEMSYHEANGKKGLAIVCAKVLGKMESKSRSHEVTVMCTDWQPPAVNPRNPSGKPVRFAGLASVFIQAA